MTTNTQQEFDWAGAHKYNTPQRVYKGTVFIIKEEFDRGYLRYAMKIRVEETHSYKWVGFERDTITKFGKIARVPGKFNDKEFIRIALMHHDWIES